MRSLTCTSTRLHVNACLRERRGCDTPHHARSVAVSATVVIDEHEAGKRMQANNGYRMHAQPHLKTEVPRDAS